jgi:hypothetical protein
MTPDQVRNIREFDEAETMILNKVPGLWRRLYERCMEEGFYEDQSMELVKTTIHAMFGKKKE